MLKFFLRNNRAQSVVEYTILVVFAAAALAYMFSYIRSASMHRMKVGVDGVGRGLLFPP